MKDLLILIAFGLILVVLGIALLKRETRIFDNPIFTSADVVKYDDYRGTHNLTLYTMVAEYQLEDGTVIQAREQSGSSRIKYPIGTKLAIYYSKEKPDLFIIQGDKSRQYAFYGMIITGLVIMAGVGYQLMTKYL